MITAWYNKELDNSNLWGGSNTIIKVEVKKPVSEVLDLVSRINKEVKNRSIGMISILFGEEWYAVMKVYCTTNELYTNEGVIEFFLDKDLEYEDIFGDTQDFLIVWKDRDDF